MGAETVGFFLVCECGVQVFIPDRAMASFHLPAGETFVVSCPMCDTELYRFVNGAHVEPSTMSTQPPDPDVIPASPEVRQYHASQGKHWQLP